MGEDRAIAVNTGSGERGKVITVEIQRGDRGASQVACCLQIMHSTSGSRISGFM